MNKVEFKDQRQTVDIELPSYPGSIVRVFKTLRNKDRDYLDEKYPNRENDKKESEMHSKELIVGLIKEWNFALDGVDVEINLENINAMPDDDQLSIMAAYMNMSLEDMKKKSMEKLVEMQKKSA